MDGMGKVRGLSGALCLVLAVASSALAGSPGVRAGQWPDGRVRPYDPHPSALLALSDCDQLRGYATEAIVDMLVRARYSPWMYEGTPWSNPGDGSGGGAPGDFTGTNNQEQGVDELDLMKTDGWYVYVAMDDALTIVRSWPPAESEIASRLVLDGYPQGMFLFGDWALVISSFWDDGDLGSGYWYGTRLDLVDVSDRTQPLVVRSIEVEGYLVGARMIDGHVYVVVYSWMNVPAEAWELMWDESLGLPEVDWEATPEEREAAANVARQILTPLVAQIVAGLELEDLVPLFRDWSVSNPEPEATPLLDCEDVLRPAQASSFSYLDVLHLDLGVDEPWAAPVETVGLLAEGWTVYASPHSLYLAESGGWWWWTWPSQGMKTTIHKFALKPEAEDPVQYVATGQVPGWLLNQFSMSEHEGYLRVATTEFDWWWWGGPEEDQGSLVTVLRDQDNGQLKPVGQVSGIAPGEQIYATRFMGDRGFLVTFVQVDPLFTLDLSDPAEPRIVGELELPGYSSYLHPVDDNHLLGVGMKADLEGRVTGLAVNLFDVTDFAHPELADQFVIESQDNLWSWSEALSDHHAFTFHRGVLSFPMYIYSGAETFSGLEVLSVDVEDGIEELGRVDHDDLPAPEWGWPTYPSMRRSAYIEDYLYSLSSWGMKVNQLFDPAQEIAVVPFYE